MSNKLKFFGYSIFIIIFIVIAILDSDFARNEPINSYIKISGQLHDKGFTKPHKGEWYYYIRIKNSEGDYKIKLNESDAPKKFLEQVMFSKNAEARILRTGTGIHLIQLKINAKYVLRQKRT